MPGVVADVPGMRWCCGSCAGANGAARCDGVALVLVQADRVSPARTRTAAESTTGPVAAAVSHRHRRSRSCLHRACAVPMCYTRCCLTAASARPQRAPCVRCGAARCPAVALVLMQADRVSPARTRTAAESTSGPIVAAVSTDIDGNGLCVHRACTAAEWPTHGHTQHTPVGPQPDAMQWLWF